MYTETYSDGVTVKYEVEEMVKDNFGQPVYHGDFKRYSRKGILLEHGRMSAGRRQGPWTIWYSDGSLEAHYNYTDGEEDGIQTYYHPNSTKAFTGLVVMGLRAGTWTCWWDNGNKKSEGDWIAGQMEGEWSFWDRSGNLIGTYTYFLGTRQ